jgi:hypothetical protein
MRKIDDAFYRAVLALIIVLCFVPWQHLRRTSLRLAIFAGLILLAFYVGYSSPKVGE